MERWKQSQVGAHFLTLFLAVDADSLRRVPASKWNSPLSRRADGTHTVATCPTVMQATLGPKLLLADAAVCDLVVRHPVRWSGKVLQAACTTQTTLSHREPRNWRKIYHINIR